MSGRLTHVAMALLTAASLVISPVYAQSQSGQPQDAQQSQSTSQPQQAAPTAPPAPSAVPSTPRSLSLSAGPNYSNGKPFFPNVFAPYTFQSIEAQPLTNSPRLSQLIQDGKLNLSLEDAVSLALENNLDIRVQRFLPWLAQVNLLRTKAGGASFGTGSSAPVLLGSAPAGGFDPVFSSSVTLADQTLPVNNPFISGTGSSALSALSSHSTLIDFGYAETFHTGTSFSLSWNNTRSSSAAANIFNPSVQSQLSVTISQPLLAGFGLLPNIRYILEAKNTLKINDAMFAQAVIADVTQVENYYWELVYARENVKVEQTTVATDQQLYENNKKQLEIGTMAPLDVLTAESQLASDQQALVAAQTTQLQDETLLLNSITKNPLDASLAGVEIIPTTPLSTPDVVENIPIQDAAKEAWSKRPELQQTEWTLKNYKIEVRVAKNALLPSASAFFQYGATGLGGNGTFATSTTPTAYAPILSEPIVDANGNILNVGYPGSPIFPTTARTGGLGNALNSMINANFPSFVGGINFSLPIRNRAAQANSAQTQLNERQLEVTYRESENTIFVQVRNAAIALTQFRAQVAAAEKARNLAQQTLDDEQKKFQLGSSNSFTVTQRIQALTAAAGTEVRARANLAEAYVNFNQAMGRTLEANNITLADARTGSVSSAPNIPGWTPPAVTPGKK